MPPNVQQNNKMVLPSNATLCSAPPPTAPMRRHPPQLINPVRVPHDKRHSGVSPTCVADLMEMRSGTDEGEDRSKDLREEAAVVGEAATRYGGSNTQGAFSETSTYTAAVAKGRPSRPSMRLTSSCYSGPSTCGAPQLPLRRSRDFADNLDSDDETGWGSLDLRLRA
jgi:hypothetical protein